MLYITLFLIALFGAIMAFRFEQISNNFIRKSLSFSGAYLLSICFLHLLPELFESNTSQLGLFVMIGFFLQLTLDYFSGGIEHGHIHLPKKQNNGFPILIFSSLFLHAFLEAIPMAKFESNPEFFSFFLGLIVHKAPIAFILASLLLKYKISKSRRWLTIILFALAAPAGIYLGELMALSSYFLSISLALSVGIILHLSTTILLETNEEHQIEWSKVFPMLLGAGTGLLSLIFH